MYEICIQLAVSYGFELLQTQHLLDCVLSSIEDISDLKTFQLSALLVSNLIKNTRYEKVQSLQQTEQLNTCKNIAEVLCKQISNNRIMSEFYLEPVEALSAYYPYDDQLNICPCIITLMKYLIEDDDNPHDEDEMLVNAILILF